MGQGLPDLLGDEGHEGMQQLQSARQHVAQYPLGPAGGFLVLSGEAGLAQFDIPVAEVVPDEGIELVRGDAQFVAVDVLGDFLHQGVVPAQDPLILQIQLPGQVKVLHLQIHQQEAGSVPDLVAEVAVGLHPLVIETGVVAGGDAGAQGEAQGVGAVFVDDLHGVDAVAQGFGHLAALVIPDDAVDEHILEGDLLHLLHAGEDHPGHPEEDDVIAGDQHGGGIEILQLGGLVRPAHGGEGPQGGAEPGVQHILVLAHMGGAALGTDGDGLLADGHLAAVIAVIGGDLVAPPQLAGDAPVMDVLHPVGIGLGEPLGDKADVAVIGHPEGFLGQGGHLHEPLGRDQRLHIVVAAVAGAHVVAVILGLDQIALLLQVFDDGLAALVTVHTLVGAAVFVDGAVVSDAADDLQIVPQAHLEVVGVVGGGHLHRAGAEAQLYVIIGHDGDLPVHDGQDAGLAHQMLEPLILGVDGHAGIAHHGLGTGGGHHQIAGAVGQGIADIPQVAGLVGVFHLGVRQGGGAVGAPVDDAAALVDIALLIQVDEDLLNGLGAALVHGKAQPPPVAGAAHGVHLLDDAGSVLLLPLPDPFQELFPAQVVAGQALLAELLLHLDLGGDAGVVGAGHPQGGIALHPLGADQDVLQGVVKGVAHVELAGDVGGRQHDGIGLFVFVHLGVEEAAVQPELVQPALRGLGVIGLGQFLANAHRGISSYYI